jgi:extradiol dioxygenase family protein
MAISLNHTIIVARDKEKTAAFLTEILGLSPHTRLGHFAIVHVDDTSLDFVETDAAIEQRHFAFLVSEDEFDAIFERIRERRLPYWADPFRRQPGKFNTYDDGRASTSTTRTAISWKSSRAHMAVVGRTRRIPIRCCRGIEIQSLSSAIPGGFQTILQ